MSIQNFKAVILLIISILIQQLHLELFGGTTLESLAFKHCTAVFVRRSELRIFSLNCTAGREGQINLLKKLLLWRALSDKIQTKSGITGSPSATARTSIFWRGINWRGVIPHLQWWSASIFRPIGGICQLSFGSQWQLRGIVEATTSTRCRVLQRSMPLALTDKLEGWSTKSP